MNTYYVVSVGFKNEQCDFAKIQHLAQELGTIGIEEISLNEEELDLILGEKSYGGGSIPLDVIEEIEQSLEDKKKNINIYFSKETSLDNLRQFCSDILEEGMEISIEEKENENWVESWKVHYTPQYIGEGFVVAPPWFQETLPADEKIKIWIDPAQAFGTGTHETTQLCLEIFEKIYQKLDDKLELLDFGCGSGILGIGALKLKKCRVSFVDCEEESLHNTVVNCCLNNISEDFYECSLEIVEKKYDFIFANVLTPILLSYGERLHSVLKENGTIILSGILLEQQTVIENKYSALGFKLNSVTSKNQWIAMEWQKK
jgi:ribosomal protein L11 methyltransferase